MDAKTQRDWLAFFDWMATQQEARERLIDGLPLTDRRIVLLLRALAKIAQEHHATLKLPDGSWELAVPIATLQQQLGVRSRNTAKTYIDLASATPYLSGDGSNHSAHTFRICWLAIVDDSRNGRDVEGECTAARKPAAGQGRGSIRRSGGGQFGGGQGGQLTPSKGVNLEASKGVKLASKLEASNPPLSSCAFGIDTQGSNTLGFYRNSLKAQGIQYPDGEGVKLTPSAERTYPRNFWPLWKGLIRATDFRSATAIDQLWEFCVAWGVCERTYERRLDVFAQAAKVTRPVQSIEDPLVVFKENVAKGRWFASCADYDRAAQLIAEADFGEPYERPRASHDELESAIDQDEDELREHAKAQLAAWAAAKGS